MRCVVFAYHDIGYVCLETLLQQGATVSLVFTHDDDPGEEVWFRSVRRLAERHSIPTFAPTDVNASPWIERVAAAAPDYIFSFFYRRLLGRALLDLAKHGALNLHGSLLPRYRGRCPVNWVLIHDEHETGVTLHYMDEKPDHGDIVAQRRVTISDADTAHSLFGKLTLASRELMRDIYPQLLSGTLPRRAQLQSDATYFGGRKPSDGKIDWQQTSRQLYNLVRALTQPYPGAFTYHAGKPLFVWEAAHRPAQASTRCEPGEVLDIEPELLVQTGEAALSLLRVQSEGEDAMSGVEWAKTHAVQKGNRLG